MNAFSGSRESVASLWLMYPQLSQSCLRCSLVAGSCFLGSEPYDCGAKTRALFCGNGSGATENTRPRLDRCSAHRVRPDRPHRPRSRPVCGPPLRQLASDPFHPVEGGSCNDYVYVFGDPINSQDLEGLGADPLHPCAGTNISLGGARLTITEVGRNDAAGWVRYNINWEADGKYARKANYTSLNVTGRRPGMKTPTLLAAIDSRRRDATRAQSKPYYAHTTQTLQIGTELRLNGKIDYFLPWYGFGVTGVSVIGTCRA